MFELKLDITPNGYDIDQTNFYLKNLQNKIETLEKQNEYLTQEAMKLRRFVDDMKIDIKMLSASIDALRRR